MAVILSLPGYLDPSNPPAVTIGLNNIKLAFDAGTDEITYFSFPMPDDYSSTPVLKINYAATSATSGDVVWACQVMAVSSGDSQDVDTASYAAINSATDTVPGTAGHLKSASISITNNDSLAAGDHVFLKLFRDADNASDTAAGDIELISARLEYTTA